MIQKNTNMDIKQKPVFFILLIIVFIGSASKCTAQQKVNIEILFWMLPADALPGHIDTDKQTIKEQILVCDYKNGYLELGGGQFTWEMCYWNLKDGRKLVAVNNHTEYGSIIRTFFYEKGKLREDKNYKLGGEQLYKPEDLIDTSQLTPKILSRVKKAFNQGNYKLYFGLPRSGTSLKVWLNNYSLLEEHDVIPYEAQKTVTIKWINEIWVKQ